MINRIRHNGNIGEHHEVLPIKQIYAWIYVKSKKRIIIVSKDGNNRQMPGGKPEAGESFFETLQREIREETSLKLNLNSNDTPTLFGYYYIKEIGEEYLQLRYFIEIEDVDEKNLKPNEKSYNDSIHYVKLVDIDKIPGIIPRLSDSLELNGFMKILNSTILFEPNNKQLP